jgi:hypothetical protein
MRSRRARLAVVLAGVGLIAAPPGALADNCGSLSDCFFTLETAIIAALMIALLIVLIIEFAPILLAAEEVGLAAGTGAFVGGAEGGVGLGSLVGVEMEITAENLSTVAAHLAQFGEWGPNAAMLQRLTAALEAGNSISGADLVFYTHELLESQLMASGMSYEAAHAAALAEYGVSEFSVYAPEVIQAFPELFNLNWLRFWGLIP